jgi:1,2-diacylglycerol 3-beta-glucosyltransferase
MVPDLLMAVIRSRPMLLSPLSELTLPLFILGTLFGLKQIRRSHPTSRFTSEENPNPKPAPFRRSSGFFAFMQIPFQALFGSIYMFHWLPIVASMTARISVRPKRLKWVKTVHQGAADLIVD